VRVAACFGRSTAVIIPCRHRKLPST
jgi:hypothetical protein